MATHDLTCHINSWLSREGEFAINDDTVLAVDLGDIRKTYAKTMEFRSENDQIIRAIFQVTEATRGRGIVAIDRGGDRREILIPLLDKGIRFVLRQRGDRHVLLSGERRYAVATAVRRCQAEIEREVEIEKEGCRRKYTLRLGTLPVRMPERPNIQLWDQGTAHAFVPGALRESQAIL